MNKKAFTLIELLAVIVIIALIAVITLPIIGDSIDKSKKKIAESSALGYVRSVDEFLLHEEMVKNSIRLNGDYNISSTGAFYNENNSYELNLNGKKPTNGLITFNNNDIVRVCVTINEFAVIVVDGEVFDSYKGSCFYD